MNSNRQQTINQRVKKLREALEMTQSEMSRVLSLSSGYLAGIEVEKRKVNDRFVKLVCSSFNVREAWLRDGAGDMFAEPSDEQFIKLASLYKELKHEYRQFVIKQINLLLQMQDEEAKKTP